MTSLDALTLVDMTGEDLGTMRGLLPTGRSAEGTAHLYVIAFGEYVKVGVTNCPTERFPQHRAGGLHILCGPPRRAWISTPHVMARDNEKSLLRYCRDMGGKRFKYRTEVFHGLDAEAVISRGISLVSPHQAPVFLSSIT